MTTLIKEIESKLKANVETSNEEERVLDMVKGELKNAELSDVHFLKERGYNVDSFKTNQTRNFLTREDIRTLAASYRFRCLPLNQFRGQIDPAVIQKMKAFEVEHPYVDYRVMAPVSMFELREPKDIDPLLFAQVGSEWHLIHKWGSDATLLRKMLVLPLRDRATLTATAVLFIVAYWLLGGIAFGGHSVSHLVIGGILSVATFMFTLHTNITAGNKFSDEIEILSYYNVFEGTKRTTWRPF